MDLIWNLIKSRYIILKKLFVIKNLIKNELLNPQYEFCFNNKISILKY